MYFSWGKIKRARKYFISMESLIVANSEIMSYKICLTTTGLILVSAFWLSLWAPVSPSLILGVRLSDDTTRSVTLVKDD